MTLVAVTAAVTVTISEMPAAPASAGVTHPGSAGHGHGYPDSFRLSSNTALCLANAPDYCEGYFIPVADDIWAILSVYGASKTIIAFIEWLLSKVGSSDKEEKTGGDPPNSDGDGLCWGAWGYNSDVHLGSCTSLHGIYWQLQPYNDGYRLWNTYSGGYLTAASLNIGGRLFVSGPEDWQTWFNKEITTTPAINPPGNGGKG